MLAAVSAHLPFMLGATEARFVDSCVRGHVGHDHHRIDGIYRIGLICLSFDSPKGCCCGVQFCSGLGGIGIIVVAMVFLPELAGLAVGRSQIRKPLTPLEKFLPRVPVRSPADFGHLLWLLLPVPLTIFNLGMERLDATVSCAHNVVHGGFSNYDAAFGHSLAMREYADVDLHGARGVTVFVRYVPIV